MQTKEVGLLRRLIRETYQELLVDRYKDQTFWILFAFIPTFIIARVFVELFPETYVPVNGFHVHHFAYGFVILAVAGFIAIVRPHRAPPWLAALYGVGLALAIDEAGMWLQLTSYYYNETSENIIIIVVALLINLVYFRHFWLRLSRVTFGWLRN
jgi:hypothetical protein